MSVLSVSARLLLVLILCVRFFPDSLLKGYLWTHKLYLHLVLFKKLTCHYLKLHITDTI